jgi:bifunctional NMN adenylyltransferase/nudix hydrolase
MSRTLGVYIGRMQGIHYGHIFTIEQMVAECDHALILFGSAFIAPDTKNPLSCIERSQLLEQVAGNIDYSFAGIRDYSSTNRWILAVQKAVEENAQAFDCDRIILYGNEKDSSSWYLKLFPQWERRETKLHKIDDKSMDATTIRRLLFEDHKDEGYIVSALSGLMPMKGIDWLLNFRKSEKGLWLQGEYAFEENYKKPWRTIQEGGTLPYAVPFQTVDNVVLWRGLVLLGIRKNRPGMGLWALPGGFLDLTKNETRRQGAIRELKEETKPQVFRRVKAGGLVPIPVDENWITAHQGFDDPRRSRRGRIITEAYLWRIPDELEVVHKAGDDLAKTKFFPLHEVLENMGEVMFEDHHSIIGEMTLRN